MDTGDIIPPASKPLFLGSITVIESEMILFCNISNSHEPSIVEEAIQAIVLEISPYIDISQHMDSSAIMREIMTHRPTLVHPREQRLIVRSYDISFPIIRISVGRTGMPVRYMNFPIEGTIQSVVFVQFMSLVESEIMRRPNTASTLLLRGLVQCRSKKKTVLGF